MTQDHELPQFEREILEFLEACEHLTVLRIDGQIYELVDAGGAKVWHRVYSLSWWKHHHLALYLYRRGVRVIDITRLIPEAS